jgi:hypothetical protein
MQEPPPPASGSTDEKSGRAAVADQYLWIGVR